MVQIIIRGWFFFLFVFFIGLILDPILVYVLVSRNTIVYGLTNTGMLGELGINSIFLFFSAFIFISLFNVLRSFF